MHNEAFRYWLNTWYTNSVGVKVDVFIISWAIPSKNTGKLLICLHTWQRILSHPLQTEPWPLDPRPRRSFWDKTRGFLGMSVWVAAAGQRGEERGRPTLGHTEASERPPPPSSLGKWQETYVRRQLLSRKTKYEKPCCWFVDLFKFVHVRFWFLEKLCRP